VNNAIDVGDDAVKAVVDAIKSSIANRETFDAPYRHWILRDLAPGAVIDTLRGESFAAPELAGVSGKRELHNDQRHYFDTANAARSPAMAAMAAAYQSADLARFIGETTGADLDDTFLRIEYAIDVTGFWLQPHTDLGVKRLTILHYISDDPDQADCGTDIYHADKSHAKRTPFAENLALMFVPGDATYHGFESRPIAGVRKSLIVNYVTHEWRDREQLCFPDTPVRL